MIVGSSNNGGISYSDWYNLQEAYNNGYNNGYTNGYDNGYNNGYNSGYQNGSNSNQEEQSWWSSWGKCATGSILTGAGVGLGSFVSGASLGTLSPVGLGIIFGTLAATSTWLVSC